MTTPNTIIEEEIETTIRKIDDIQKKYWFENTVTPQDEELRELLTTAMQRAYEAGVAETIKAGVSVIKGEKKDAREIRDLYFPNVKGEPVPNEEWADIINWKNAFNEGNSTAVTALQGLGK